MLLNPIRDLLQTVELRNFDGLRMWDVIKDAPCSWIEEPEELFPYCTLSVQQEPVAPHLIITPVQGVLHVSALVSVADCGLTNLLFTQLRYVPKFAILEWHLEPQSSTMRDLVYCMGYAGLIENYGKLKPAFASLTGKALDPMIAESLKYNPTQTQSWCFGAVHELRRRALIIERPIYHNVWTVNLLQTGVYGLQ